MSTVNNQQQLVYLPYLNLGYEEEISIGPVRIWNFDLKKNEYIPDPQVRSYIEKLVRTNTLGFTRKGEIPPLEGIGIVSLGEVDFREFSAREDAAIARARSALFLACLAKNAYAPRRSNSGFAIYTTENFRAVYQRFIPESPYIAETDGFVVSMTNMGLELGKVHFAKPSYVNIPRGVAYDTDLLTELANERRYSASLRNRVFSASAILLESYYNNPYVHISARVLLQAAALEMLLQSENREAFKDKIEHYLNNKGKGASKKEPRYRYRSERSRPKNGQRAYAQEVRSIRGMWADRFYTLRNHIIHGENVPRRDYIFRRQHDHVLIAPLVFIALVRELLNEALVSGGREEAFSGQLLWQPSDHEDEPNVSRFQLTKHSFWHAAKRAAHSRRPRATKSVIGVGNGSE
jgi:hypothetical protein